MAILRSSRFWGMAAAGILVILAFALRLFRLENKNIWWDEGWSVWLARQDLGSIAATTAADEHPPLHYWFLHFWDGWAGETEFAVRFSSVLFAVLTVALIYRLGRELWGRPWGLATALLLATLRFHVWWSQEVKMYAPAVLLALLSLYFFLRLLREPKTRFWVGYVVANLAGLYLVYFHIFVLMVTNLSFVILWWRKGAQRPSWLSWVKAQGVVALGFLPWLVYFLTQARSWERLPPLDLAQYLKLYLTSVPLGLTWNVDQVLPLALPFAILALLGLGVGCWSWRAHRSAFALVAMLAMVGFPAVLYLMSLLPKMPYHPKLAARYFILFLPIYALVLVQGIRLLTRWRPLLGVAALAVILALGGKVLLDYYPGRYATYNLENLVSFVEAYSLPGDALVLNSAHDWPVVAYYNDQNISLYRIPRRNPRKPLLTAPEVDQILAPALSRHPSLWLVTTKDATPQATKAVDDWLRVSYWPVVERQYGSNTLTLWTRGTDGHGLARRLPKQVDESAPPKEREIGGVRLLGFDGLPDELRTNDTLYVVSYWQATADKVADDLKVRLLLRDESGQEVLARAAGSLSPFKVNGRWRRGQTIRAEQRLGLATLPSGEFRVELEVEDPLARRRLTIPLGPVDVESRNWISPQPFTPKPLEITWNGQIRLLGYYLPESSFQATNTIPLTLFWESSGTMDRNYLVILRLVDAQGVIWGNNWSTPPWRVGVPASLGGKRQVIGERYEVPLEQDLPPGEYTLLLGLVDDETGNILVPSQTSPLAPAAMVEMGRITVE